VFPCASDATADSEALFPVSIVTSDGLTPTFATGTSRTVTLECPAIPSMTAVMTAVPGIRPVTRPV
jgi:hypothetical protein